MEKIEEGDIEISIDEELYRDVRNEVGKLIENWHIERRFYTLCEKIYSEIVLRRDDADKIEKECDIDLQKMMKADKNVIY